MSEAPAVAPYLFYSDVAAAARFLHEAFGFSLGFTSTNEEGGMEHAQLHHGGCLLMLGHAGGGGLNLVKSARDLPALHAGTYVFVDDVDAHCARAKKAGATVLLAPKDQPWGDRMYCCTDLEGQFWMFAKRLKP